MRPTEAFPAHSATQLLRAAVKQLSAAWLRSSCPRRTARTPSSDAKSRERGGVAGTLRRLRALPATSADRAGRALPSLALDLGQP